MVFKLRHRIVITVIVLVGTFINVGDDEDTQVEAGGRFATHTKRGRARNFWHVKWQAPPADFFCGQPCTVLCDGSRVQ